MRNFGQALSRILAFAVVGVGASLRRQPFVPLHLCIDSHLCRCIVQRLCVAVFMHPCITALCGCLYASLHNDFVRPPSCILCTFMNALLVSHPCETLGVHFIRHPCLTRKLRVLPPTAPKIIPRLLSGVLFLVPMAGVEPARYCYQRILSPSRLPIPSHRLIKMCYKTALYNGNNDFTV